MKQFEIVAEWACFWVKNLAPFEKKMSNLMQKQDVSFEDCFRE